MRKWKEGDIARLRDNGCVSGLLSGTLGTVRYCGFNNKDRTALHFHAKHEGIGAIPPSAEQQHRIREVCHNPKRWEFMPQLSYMEYNYTKPDPMRDNFWEELEEKLDEHFPKGQTKSRGAALVMFAEAVILHKKYKNK